MIEYLEDNDIQLYKKAVMESIKCHYNDITNYFIEKFIDKLQKVNYFYDDINHTAIEYCNYYYLPDDIISIISNPERAKYKMLFLNLFSNITISSKITSIGKFAFAGCFRLIHISIPFSVISIGEYAFSGCSGLAQITIPSSITSIGNYVFNKCSSLTQITIPSSVTSIGNYTFNGCSIKGTSLGNNSQNSDQSDQNQSQTKEKEENKESQKEEEVEIEGRFEDLFNYLKFLILQFFFFFSNI